MSPSFKSIKVGDAPAPLVCGPLTRTQFVRYAGASPTLIAWKEVLITR